MPVLGGSQSTAFPDAPIIKPGIYVPAGWGSAWRAARDNAANELVEVSAFGDSTTAGSTRGGTPHYSWITRLRARFLDAGFPDGGKGLIGPNDDTFDYAEIDGEVSGIVSNDWNGSNPIHALIGGGSFLSSTPGQVLTVQGYGTCVRVFYATNAGGNILCSIDGGAPTTLSYVASGARRLTEVFYQGGLTEGLHTVELECAVSHVSCTPAIQRNSGLVFHRIARGGARTLDWWDSQAENGGWSPVLWRSIAGLGLATTATSTPTTAFDAGNMGLQLTEGTHPNLPRTRLAIHHLGFNDFTNIASDGANLNTVLSRVGTSVASFCKMAQAAGADPLVLSGQLFFNSNYRKWAGPFTDVIRGAALSNGAAWADVTTPLGTQPGTDPHLTVAQYQEQGDWLFEEILSQ